MKQRPLFHSTLAAGVLLVALPAFSAGINSVNNGMPNRLSMNCTTAKGKPVTDPATCASEDCVDANGKKVTDPSVCASPPAGQPAPQQSGVVKSKSNITNN